MTHAGIAWAPVSQNAAQKEFNWTWPSEQQAYIVSQALCNKATLQP